MPRASDLARPLTVAVAGAAMAAATWGTWPDAIYDYGTHLYVPWRLSAGQRLYGDIAYFYGPLSEYLNAALFRAFGVGLSTLVWANLAVLAAVLAIVFRLAGMAAALVVVGVFAFGQYVGIGNYNWVCPYCHEVTHGVALGLAAVAAMAAHLRDGRRPWLVAAGAAVGLCLLTKPEVSAPAVLAVAVGVALAGRCRATESRDVHPGLRTIRVTVPAVLVLVVAFSLLALHGGRVVAVRGLVGPWEWVFDRRVSSLQFYRQGMGTDDVAGNLGRLAIALAVTAVPIGAGLLAGWRRWRAVGLAAAVVGLAGLAGAFDVARPWPVLVAGVLAVSVERAWRGPMADRPAWAGRAVLAVLALGLLAKMALAARVSQYGFALAMPAAVVLTDAAVRWGPAWVTARGGDGPWARAVAFAYIAPLVTLHVAVTLGFAAGKRTRVGEGADAFWADGRGTQVNAVVRAVASADTVVVAPQGLMVNYLARRVDPLTVVNLMPPELASAGEDRVLAGLARRPPAAVVLVGHDMANGGFVLTEGHYVYGRAIVEWVRGHYVVDSTAAVPAGEPGLVVMRRR
jgi:hypothetical protein